ncbi:MAG: extracellular solute-binding protein [Pseudomonadota bacterium]
MADICATPFRLGLALAAGLSFQTPALAQDTITSHGFSTFGELKYAADFPHFEYVNPSAPKGGTMSFRGVGASRTFDSLNPFILKGEWAQGYRHTYDQLLVRAWDEPDAVYGQLAASIEYPEDRSWVIFTLRPEARFSDGHPVTAEDVVWTIEALQTMGAPNWQVDVEDVESAEVLDEHRVKVTFREEATTRDLPSLVGQLYILPKHYYEDVAFDESTLVPPLGSGPYIIDDLEPGRTITYCRNPDYWGADLPVNRGRDNFECLRYEYFADDTASFEALKAGEYVFHEEYFSKVWATSYDFPALERGWVIREVIPDGRPGGAQGFWFNLRRPQFQDIRVREAIALMFNFEWSNETLFYGLYNRTDSFWEGSVLEASGLPEGSELEVLDPFRDALSPEVFTEPAYTPPVAGTRQNDRGMLREASALLDAAGWMVGDDGLRRNAEGETLKLALVDDSPSFERVIIPFVENLKTLGVDASHELIDAAQMQERQEVFDYDMIPGRFVLPLSPSVEMRSLYGSATADQNGSYNLSGLKDPVVDALINRVIEAGDRATMTARVHALDRVLRAKHIWVPNWNKGEHWLAYWDIFGRPDIKPPYDRGIDFWWFDQEKFDALRAAGALR